MKQLSNQISKGVFPYYMLVLTKEDAFLSRIPMNISSFMASSSRSRWGSCLDNTGFFFIGNSRIATVFIFIQKSNVFFFCSCGVCLATVFVVPQCHEIKVHHLAVYCNPNAGLDISECLIDIVFLV